MILVYLPGTYLTAASPFIYRGETPHATPLSRGGSFAHPNPSLGAIVSSEQRVSIRKRVSCDYELDTVEYSKVYEHLLLGRGSCIDGTCRYLFSDHDHELITYFTPPEAILLSSYTLYIHDRLSGAH